MVEDYEYHRRNLFNVVLTALFASAAAAGVKLVFATGEVPDVLARRAHAWLIEDFAAGDFAAICSAYLDQGGCGRIDFADYASVPVMLC